MMCLLCLIVSSLAVNQCWSACEVKWVKDIDLNKLPDEAVLVAPDNPAGEFYVARAKVPEGPLTSGCLVFKERQFLYTMDGKEHSLHDNFEVLTNPNGCTLVWRRAFGGTFPKGSIVAGEDKQGVSYYSMLHFKMA